MLRGNDARYERSQHAPRIPPPPLGDVRFLRVDGHYLIELHWGVAPPLRSDVYIDAWRLTEAEQADWGARPNINDVHRLWSEMLEDHMMHRRLDEAQQQYLHAVNIGAPATMVHHMRQEVERLEQHVGRHHGRISLPNRVYSSNTTADAYTTVVSATERQRLSMQMGHHIQLGSSWIEVFNGGDVGTPEAKAKGEALLQANLSPEQRVSLQNHGHFDVKGGQSGKTYRIKRGRQMNCIELDAKGKEVQGWCFLPSGGLVEGDTMLGQKLALEANEATALKTANRFDVGTTFTITGVERYRPNYYVNPRGFDVT